MNAQLSLFDPEISFLSLPFAGETLYSWCARFHRLSTNTNAKLTSQQLFKDSLAGFRHDFPTHLDNFFNITNPLFGSVERLVYDRTTFAIFAPFLTPAINQTVIQEMQHGGYSQIKNYLGLRASSIATVAPLKACPSCMREDSASSGMAWWHFEHQLPTIRLCPRHGDYLLMPTQEFHSRALDNWFLPMDLHSKNWYIAPALNEPCTDRLRNLCKWSQWVVNFHGNPFNHELLRLTYHLRAKAMGLSSIDGTMNFNKFRSAFREAYACLEILPGFSFIKETAYEHGGFLSDILFKRGLYKHPLRHVFMLEFLFRDPDIFLAEYEHVLSASIELSWQELWAELIDSRNPLKLLVTDAGYSANAAARQLNIPLSQAISFLKKEGIEYKRNKKMLDANIEKLLINLLKAGKDRDEIASTLGLRGSFIITYVDKNPELHEAWKKALHERTTESMRSEFLKFLTDNPGLPIKTMKQEMGSSFQWLQRNDKNWLKQNLPGIWQQSDKLQLGQATLLSLDRRAE